MGTIADLLNTAMRDFVRYTGDGLPGEPVGRPLPVGDPASGQFNPPKKLVRDAFLAIAETADDLIEAVEGASEDRVQTGLDREATQADAAASLTYRDQAQVAAIAAGAPIVTTLTDPVPADDSVEILQTDSGTQVWQVASSAWGIVGWLTRPEFDTIAQMAAATALVVGQSAKVRAGENGENEDFTYRGVGDLNPSAFVVASAAGGWWVSKRKIYRNWAHFKGDTRGYDGLTVGEVFKQGQYFMALAPLVAVDAHVETDGGLKFYVQRLTSGRYPAPAFGPDAAALQKAWQVAGADGVELCGATYTIDALIDEDADIHIYGPGTIKHADAATDKGYRNIGGTTLLRGLTIDGNRANQTARFDFLQQGSGDIRCEFVHFTGVVSSGFRVNGTMGDIVCEYCVWDDIEEHGGGAGETSHAAYIVCTSAKKVRFAFNDVRHGLPSSPGYSPSGFFVSVSTVCPCDFLFNYFENVGQNVAGNFSGCIDFYTNAHCGTVIGNRAVNSYWVPFKLQIGDSQIVHSNRVEGVDATAGGGMAFLQNTRSYGAALNNAVVGSNFIDLGEGIDLPAILLQGSDDFHSDGIIVRDTIIPRCGKVASIDRFGQVEMIGTLCDSQLSVTGSIEVKNTDQGSGAPVTARVVIKGGRLPGNFSSAVFARTNVTNLDLTVEGVNFTGNGSGAPMVSVRNAKALRFNKNDYESGSITQLDAQTINVVQVDGNRGPTGALVLSGIGDLDYGYNPGCWDFSGSKIFDPGSIAAGGVLTTTVTVTGAGFSTHDAVATFTSTMNGVLLSAWVSGSSTVTVQFYNPTAAAVDLASSTLSARAKRRFPLAS